MRSRLTISLAAFAAALATLAPTIGNADKFVFTPEQVERSAPPSRSLHKALGLYAKKDFYSATILLHAIVKGETGDSPPSRQRAQFFMGKALYHLRFYSASFAAFDQIVVHGAAHRYYDATLRWLASLSRKLPASTGILARIASYGPARLEHPALAGVRDELRYLVGRHHYNKGDLKRAVELFRAVPNSASLGPRARYLEGVTHSRLGDTRAAAAAFSATLAGVKPARPGASRDEQRRLAELATLALARVHYAAGRLDRSLAFYAKVSRRSGAWLDAVFEASWTHFRRGDFGRALGNIHTLDAPYFEQHFFPESQILKAVVYYKHCRWGRSAAAIRAFNGRYPPLKKRVDQLLRRHRDAAELFEHARQILAEKGSSGDDVRRLTRLALDDRTIRRHFSHVRELDREGEQVRRADPAWRSTAIASVVLQDLAVQRSLAQNEAGQLTRRRFTRISRELRGLMKQAIKVEYETIRAQKEQLRILLERGFEPAPDRDLALLPDDEHHIWPFTGPYWRDELGAYRVRVRTQCHLHTPRTGGPPLARLRLQPTSLGLP